MASLHGNCCFSRLQYAEERNSSLLHRHKLANNKYFLNPNQIRRIAISANCTDTNRINMSSKPSPFNHIVDSDRLKSNSYIQPNKRSPDVETEVIAEELDRWVKDSAVEIVSNLDEAPFLVHVYGDNGDRSSRSTGIKFVREKATAEDWPFIRKRWEGGSPTPSGIILVEELCNQDHEPDLKPGKEMLEIKDRSRSSSTKAWGILIQGKGRNCTACYLLKTCQVQSVAGICTHFCLVRVDCFVEQADLLLQKMWLQC